MASSLSCLARWLRRRCVSCEVQSSSANIRHCSGSHLFIALSLYLTYSLPFSHYLSISLSIHVSFYLSRFNFFIQSIVPSIFCLVSSSATFFPLFAAHKKLSCIFLYEKTPLNYDCIQTMNNFLFGGFTDQPWDNSSLSLDAFFCFPFLSFPRVQG